MNNKLKIVALVKFNSDIAVVFNRMPEYKYTREGDLLYAVDGPFVSCYKYDRPSKAFRAFGGREFDLEMVDGTVTHCNGQWWDGGSNKLQSILGFDLDHLTMGTVERLKNCYVFMGTSCNKIEMDKMIAEYDGCIYPYWDYEKVIKFDDMRSNLYDKQFKLKRDKRNLIKQCKRLSKIIKGDA